MKKEELGSLGNGRGTKVQRRNEVIYKKKEEV
jgi:hypothetical protein